MCLVLFSFLYGLTTIQEIKYKRLALQSIGFCVLLVKLYRGKTQYLSIDFFFNFFHVLHRVPRARLSELLNIQLLHDKWMIW